VVVLGKMQLRPVVVIMPTILVAVPAVIVILVRVVLEVQATVHHRAQLMVDQEDQEHILLPVHFLLAVAVEAAEVISIQEDQ
jgi:hypothetical protein